MSASSTFTHQPHSQAKGFTTTPWEHDPIALVHRKIFTYSDGYNAYQQLATVDDLSLHSSPINSIGAPLVLEKAEQAAIYQLACNCLNAGIQVDLSPLYPQPTGFYQTPYLYKTASSTVPLNYYNAETP